jgi:putative transcriptional regulator
MTSAARLALASLHLLLRERAAGPAAISATAVHRVESGRDALRHHRANELDALCLPPVRELSAKQIRAIRIRAQMSQAVFAAVLNTSVSTVQKWEIGEKRPSGPSLKLLNVIERKGVDALA